MRHANSAQRDRSIEISRESLIENQANRIEVQSHLGPHFISDFDALRRRETVDRHTDIGGEFGNIWPFPGTQLNRRTVRNEPIDADGHDPSFSVREVDLNPSP